ncbi:FkbM family methyltransferase [Methylococcus mesophilus]|uniref:FkbM family methyltransferase n=1 Tax=Methylococcus mesophilus TaxID=2993564 RepID=UPI00224A8B15|nr:FkbM family methyltransferase [Methylococcus mesophilus]UZR28726.1 FkbM family methyltransferase [Methylococcus mesophilus]
MSNEKITKLLVGLLGKQAAYRLGRALYQQARGDIANGIATNGELMVQRCVLNAWRKSLISDSKLVVFDVGANIGDWSYEFIQNFLKSHDLKSLDLFLFEPAPGSFETLRKRLSKFDGILNFEQLVLSSDDGVDQFYINRNKYNAGTNSLYQQDFEVSPVSVTKSTASKFCEKNDIEKIHLFKCDTEGHDMEVIRGALSLLDEEKIAVLQFEYNHRWIYARNFLRDAFIFAEKRPYKIAKLQSDHLLIFTEWHFELEKFFEGNYALIHTDTLGWFPSQKASFDRFNTLRVGIE